MKINGTDIFLGAYAERCKNSSFFRQEAISVSEEKSEKMKAGIKEAFHSLNLHDRGVKVSVSKEDMDFLCSEEGFQKMKRDAADLYAKNVSQQKSIAQGRNENDLFWNNTGNQWLVFSEMLYDNGFYTGMDDEEVKRFEDTLACATFGMDCLSRSQYLTGIEFRPAQEEYKFFMSSDEAVTELESSVAALQYLSSKLLPKEQQEGFNRLIDMYYEHNSEVLSEYNNPMESFNKVIAGIYSEKSFYSRLHEEAAAKPVSEYKFTIMLGRMDRSEKVGKQYRQDLQRLFKKMKSGGSNSSVWEQIRELFQKYATNDSNDGEFRSYVYGQAQYLFEHMKNCWDRLSELTQ